MNSQFQRFEAEAGIDKSIRQAGKNLLRPICANFLGVLALSLQLALLSKMHAGLMVNGAVGVEEIQIIEGPPFSIGKYAVADEGVRPNVARGNLSFQFIEGDFMSLVSLVETK